MSFDSIDCVKRRSMNESGSIVVHELFLGSSSVADLQAYEYVLPMRNVRQEHERMLPAWLAQFASCSDAGAESFYLKFLADCGQQHRLMEVLSGLRPYSVVISAGKAFLLCRRPGNDDDFSECGNMVMLQAPESDPELPAEWKERSFGRLVSLLKSFGGLRWDVFAFSDGLIRVNELRAEASIGNFGDTLNLRSWLGAYRVLEMNSSGFVMVNGKCQFGRFDDEYTDQDHLLKCESEVEMRNHSDGSVFTVGGFSEFVDFLISEIGLTN